MYKVELIDKKLRELNIPITGVAENIDGSYRIDYQDIATEEQMHQAQAFLDTLNIDNILELEELKAQLAQIDADYGHRYIRDFAVANPAQLNPTALANLQDAEKQASSIRQQIKALS